VNRKTLYDAVRAGEVPGVVRVGRSIRIGEALLAGTLGKEVKEVPTLEAFQARFLDYAEVNNKPSTVYAKRWVLREHLVPAFGKRRLDEIGPADIEAYKARKLKDGQAAKSVNNHLCVLRKLLNLAVEWGELSHAPRVKQLRVAHGHFQFLLALTGNRRNLNGPTSVWATRHATVSGKH
jgi:hypothetical protein